MQLTCYLTRTKQSVSRLLHVLIGSSTGFQCKLHSSRSDKIQIAVAMAQTPPSPSSPPTWLGEEVSTLLQRVLLEDTDQQAKLLTFIGSVRVRQIRKRKIDIRLLVTV